jgi:cell division protein FtsB
MTAMDATADAPAPRPRRLSRRLPSSRFGVAWLVVLLIIGALLAVQFGRQVYANWETGQLSEQLAAEIAAVEAQNALLEAELDYLESDAFVGAEARRLGDVGAPDEGVLIVPEGAEAPLPADLVAARQPKPLLAQWFELFFGPR